MHSVVAAKPGDIVFTDRITGNTAGWLASSIENVEEKLELGSKRWFDLWSAGQSVAQVNSIQSAKKIISEIAGDYMGEELAE